jgi:hypothetical protein
MNEIGETRTRSAGGSAFASGPTMEDGVEEDGVLSAEETTAVAVGPERERGQVWRFTDRRPARVYEGSTFWRWCFATK